MNIINSVNNQKIKEIAKLQKAGERRARGLFIIDGAREIELAQKAVTEISELFYSPGLVRKETSDFFGLERDKITEVSETVFKKICYKESPDGYLAVAKIGVTKLKQIKLGKNPLIIVLEAVEKPGNLGAILRTAYAVGADAIIINSSQTDIYNPNVIRASEGFVFSKPVAVASVEETVTWLAENKILSYAAATTGLSL